MHICRDVSGFLGGLHQDDSEENAIPFAQNDSDLQYHKLGPMDEILDAQINDPSFDTELPMNLPSSTNATTEGRRKAHSSLDRVADDLNDTLDIPQEGFPDMGMFDEGQPVSPSHKL